MLEMIPMYAHGQCHGDRAEAKDGGPVRARGYERISPRALAASAGYAEAPRKIFRWSRKLAACSNPAAAAISPRNDSGRTMTERRKPEQTCNQEAESEGRARERQHEEGGELRGDGTAEVSQRNG